MAKLNKHIKSIGIESTDGIITKLATHFRYEILDADGNVVDKGISEAWRKELEALDAKYADVLANIVLTTKK